MDNTVSTPTGGAYIPYLKRERVEQWKRVAGGVGNGSLTAPELKELNTLRRGSRNDLRAADQNGVVGRKERENLRQDMGAVNEALYLMKNN